MKNKINPTGRTAIWSDQDILVSKTDLTGRITYANRAFMRVANYSEHELLGCQHNLVRHPDMPRGAFKLLWDTLKNNHDFFGFVKNLTKDGDHYWVFANVTEDIDASGATVGYFSVRRKASERAIQVLEPVYKEMVRLEQQAGPSKACDVSIDYLKSLLVEMNLTYDQFVMSLK